MAKKQKNMLEKEFTDIDGGKWIQTSAEDMFSLSELNTVIESIEKEKDPGEIVLARIDFRTVNKEYHEAIVDLQMRLKKREAALNKLITESKQIIDRKNKKLIELIDHVKKLQFIIDFNKLDTSSVAYYKETAPIHIIEEEAEESLFESVEEIPLSDKGEEIPENMVN
jgi:uncharacterized coiled-coil protein SlyX